MEKEFLDAKLALQQKIERKEMLTEHLCTVIEKNEERKGKQLEELLQKVRVNNYVGIQICEQETEESTPKAYIDITQFIW